MIDAGQVVRHAQYGQGTVIASLGASVVARFGAEIQQVPSDELVVIKSLEQRLLDGDRFQLSRGNLRCQAMCIESIQAEWGVFSAGAIDQLPHQVWVTQRVCQEWPTRWLIADDVGLGKTVEAGMILAALKASGRLQRILILTPSNLVRQWQKRMLDMFGLSFVEYVSRADTADVPFFKLHDNVVGSFHTLRENRNGRWDRLLECKPFDLVIVDEAHHMFEGPESDATLVLRLLRQLRDNNLFDSVLLFTGTPHRGPHHAFAKLLAILDSEIDDVEDFVDLLPYIKKYVIRNNKAKVTDAQGKPLFKDPIHKDHMFSYSPYEQQFYDYLTEFIASGRAFASGMSKAGAAKVTFSLLSMQKICASSILAAKNALSARLRNLEEKLASGDAGFEYGDDDVKALSSSTFFLTEDEPEHLKELISLAELVTSETKIRLIAEFLQSLPEGESVLLFTEYKSTQALIHKEIVRLFGERTVSFINGDDKLQLLDGRIITSSRLQTAARFNRGDIRFLICTESGGEGIDLHENCNILIHVDMPWNPMRMHQRVGRLNRYGQKEQVYVHRFRNPDTVEDRIWRINQEKLASVRQALNPAMDDPEDIEQLVLGTTSAGDFENVYLTGVGESDEEIRRQSRNLLRDVKLDDLVQFSRTANHFDASDDSQLTHLGVSDLEPFLMASLRYGRRRVTKENDILSFQIPEDWPRVQGLAQRYSKLTFSAELSREGASLLNATHPVIATAIREALKLDDQIAIVSGSDIKHPIVVFRVSDAITTHARRTSARVFGIRLDGANTLVTADELFRLLQASTIGADDSGVVRNPSNLVESIQQSKWDLPCLVADLKVPYRQPNVEQVLVVLPMHWISI
jgi:ERCC4-related helicase